MNKELVTQKQGICLVFLFILGTTVVLGVSLKAEQDAWLSLLIAMAAAVPMLFVYGRLLRLYPGENIYDMFLTLFGKVFGRVFVALFTWYMLHLSVLVVRNFSEYLHIVALTDTPQLPMVMLITIISVWALRFGMEIMGKYALIAAPALIFVLLLVTVLVFPEMQFSNLLPALNHSIGEIGTGAFETFTFPFGETVAFLCVFDTLKKNASPYRVFYVGAIVLGGGILLIATVRNICALGFPLLGTLSFPTHTTARVISIGDFFSRFEILISANFILSGFVKGCVCLLASVKGLACLFAIKDDKKLVLPVALLMMAFTGIIYSSFGEMVEWKDVYKYYALPFEVAIPVLTLVVAEIRRKRAKKLEASAPTTA